MTTRRLTEDQFRDWIDYLCHTAGFDLDKVIQQCRDSDGNPAKVQETLGMIKHMAAEVALYLNDHPDAIPSNWQPDKRK